MTFRPLGLVFFLLSACSSELAHDAPFDPLTPPSKQARGTVLATVVLENESDHAGVTLQLQGEHRTYSAESVDDGSIRLAGVDPGRYALVLSTRYFEPVIRDIEVPIGGTFDLGLQRLAGRRAAVAGKAELETYTSDRRLLRQGGVTVTLVRKRSLRGGAAPQFAPATAVPGPAPVTTVSGADGSFSAADVPVGEYEILASAPGVLETPLGEVTVDGDSPLVTAEPLLLHPLSGFVDLMGTAAGAPSTRFTQDAALSVRTTATGTDTMQLGTSADGTADGCTYGASQPYVVSANLPLLGEGNVLVCVKLRSEGGESLVLTANIIYDVTPPAPTSAQSVAPGGFVTAPQLSLMLSAGDGGSGLAGVITGATLAAAQAASVQPFQPLMIVPLGATQGPKTVYVGFVDQAGNRTTPQPVSVTLDSTPPDSLATPVLKTLGGSVIGAATNQTRVVLATGVTDASWATLQMQVSATGDYSAAAWEPYTANRLVDLPPPTAAAGEARTVIARVRDGAGNITPLTAGIGVVLDTLPPTGGSLAIQGKSAGGAVSTSTINVIANATGALGAILSTDPGFVTSTFTNVLGGSVPFDLIGGDGSKTVYARFFDEAGNPSGLVSDDVVLDTTPPTPVELRVLEGSLVNNASLSLAIAAVGAAELNVGAAGCRSGAWTTYAPSLAYTLPNTADGPKTLSAAFRDALGNTSGCVTTAVTLDLTKPAATAAKAFVLNGDATYAVSRTAQISVSVTGATQMRIANNATFAGASWQPVSSTFLWQLDPYEGMQLVYMQFRDDAGNVLDGGADGILVDTQPPANPSVVIGTGAPYANTTAVTLTLAASEATRLQLSNDGVFDAEPVTTYTTSAAWSLPNAQGVRAVYARFLDDAGNASEVASAYVILDTLAPVPGIVTLNGGALFTKSAQVSVELAAIEAREMYISESGCGTGGAWADYAPAFSRLLAGLDGPKTVYARFRDTAGNLSGCASVTITLDTMFWSPGLAQTLRGAENRSDRTKNMLVSAGYTGLTTDAVEMRLANDPGFASASWSAAATTATWMLPSGDGSKTVYTQFRDRAGNLSATLAATIELDQTGPETPALVISDITGDGYALSSTSVELSWNAAAGAVTYEISRRVLGLAAAFGTIAAVAAPVTSYGAAFTSATSGYPHYYRVRAFDDLGNVSSWSVPANTVPFEAIDRVYWVRGISNTHYEFPPRRGTYALRSSYFANVLHQPPVETPLGADIPFWDKADSPQLAFDEFFRLRTSNQDNSLVHMSAVTLGTTSVEHFVAQSNAPNWFCAFDAAGTAHITYNDQGAGSRMMYLENTGGVWSETEVTSETMVPLGIAADSLGFSYILYIDWSTGVLGLATNGTGAWVLTPLPGSPIGYKGSLVVDAGGKVHIAHADVAGALVYVTNLAGSWATETIVSGLNPDGDFDVADVAIALKPDGKPVAGIHAYWWNTGQVEVRLHERDAVAWNNTLLDSWFSSDLGGAIRVVSDETATLQLIWSDTITGRPLTLATGGNGSFTVDAATPLSSCLVHNSLLAANGDYVASAFCPDGLAVFVRRFGEWRRRSFATGLNLGTHVDADQEGNLTLAVYDPTYTRTSFSRIRIQSPFLPARRAAQCTNAHLSFDEAGRAVLACSVRFPLSDFYLYRLENGVWTTLYSETPNDVGGAPYVAHAAGGKIHATFTQSTPTWGIRYLTNARGSWESSTIYNLETAIQRGKIIPMGSGLHVIHDVGGASGTQKLFDSYATSVTAGLAGTWSHTLVETCSNQLKSAIGQKPGGDLSMAYYCGGVTDVSLHWATLSGGTWTKSLITGVGAWGNLLNTMSPPSVAFGADGLARVAYHNISSADLMLATQQAGGGWSVETVDSNGVTGFAPAVFAAPGGEMHILYHPSGPSGEVRYATNASGKWVVTTLLQQYGVLVGALDPASNPVVVLATAEKTFNLLYTRFQGVLSNAVISQVPPY